MGHRYQTVRLKEYNAQNVEGSAELQLQHSVKVVASEDHHQSRAQAHYQVEERLQALVAFVEELLVGYSDAGHQPDDPLHAEQYCGLVRILEGQPGKIGASYEDINHGPVASMQHILEALVRPPAKGGPSLYVFGRSVGQKIQL